MRKLSVLAISLLVLSGCHGKASTQTIAASADTDGTLHPGEVNLDRPATVTCMSASASNGTKAKCNINGASVDPPHSVSTRTKVYLLCEGTAPTQCSAKVTE